MADRFERLGAMLLAAEAATEAAQAFQRAGDRRAVGGARAAGLDAGRARAKGPGRPASTAPVMVVPLTPRERDIATLAAQGEASKDIAEQLFLSVRTVNNHLQNVYSKLGVAGRATARRAPWPTAPRSAPGRSSSAPVIIVSAVRL